MLSHPSNLFSDFLAFRALSNKTELSPSLCFASFLRSEISSSLSFGIIWNREGHGLNLLFLDWIDNFCIGLGKLYCLNLILPLWWCITKVLLLAACLPLAASAATDFLYLEDQQEEVLEETA
ncbi:hypothetical protein J1N35_012978, partial [Gossypium stocksii]